MSNEYQSTSNDLIYEALGMARKLTSKDFFNAQSRCTRSTLNKCAKFEYSYWNSNLALVDKTFNLISPHLKAPTAPNKSLGTCQPDISDLVVSC